MAPEVFGACYSVRSDLYAITAILYLISTGKTPYPELTFCKQKIGWQVATYKRMKRTPIDFDCSPWLCEGDSVDFCRAGLAFTPCDRPASADQALVHPWLAKEQANEEII